MENKNQENLSKNKKINDNIYLNNNLDENKDINNKKPKEIQEEESESYNFLYEKINKNLKTPFFNLLNFYSINQMKNYDENNFLNEEYKDYLSTILNDARIKLYKQFNECFESYFEKYSIEERLNKKSKLIMLKIVLDSLSLSSDEFLEKLNFYKDNPEKEIDNNIFIHQLTKSKIEELREYKFKLIKELEELRK